MTDDYTWREKALLTEQYEVECLLAEALGYPYDKEYGWVTGDHTIVTLAMEVRRRGILPEVPRPAAAAAPPPTGNQHPAGPAGGNDAAAATPTGA